MSLEIRHINKYYGQKQALKDVTVTFHENKIYGLLGRNGAGKTTLLNIVANRIFTPYGNVLLDGEPVEENDKALAKLFLINSDGLFPRRMTVREAFLLTKQFYREFNTEKAAAYASRFQLDLRARIGSLSTGYQTIFKDILALCTEVPYILMDEPVLGLDAGHRDLLYQLLLTEYGKHPRTFVLSTHLIDEIASMIEDVVMLDAGEIIADENCEALLARGYSATGERAAIEAFASGKNVIGETAIGAFLSVNILADSHPTDVPDGITVAPLDLQKLFVAMTGGTEAAQ